MPKAAATIEGHETHTRTAEVAFDLQKVCQMSEDPAAKEEQTMVRMAITQAVIYGWYDNELGSYVNILGDRIVSIAESL